MSNELNTVKIDPMVVLICHVMKITKVKVSLQKIFSFDDDKLSFFRAQKNMLMLSTEQVAQLVKPLAFGDNKLALAKEAYSRVVDPQNYYLLLDSFTFLSEKEEFKNFLAEVQR